MILVVSARRLAAVLAGAVAVLALGYVLIRVARHGFNHDRVLGLARLFDLDGEGNVPAWFSSVTLSLPAVLLAIIGWAERRRRASYAWHWLFLAVVFAGLSLDEAVGLHELSVVPLRDALHTRGVLHFPWVIPGVGFVAVMGIAYFRFVRALPPPSRRGMLLAGSFYVGGALGLELVGAALASADLKDSVFYSLAVLTEETLEMSGVVVFVRVLVAHLARELPEVRIRFGL
ncbi:MAG: hypothetical protein Q7W02_11330 [Candidatus Rokubacteria bacterium]|nr:hypothetical protein [Candidatus Rokubacteria bacterium]